MTRPRLLDLFCGAGGAAAGYHRAGFDVVGVDIEAQPRYPFEFHQADAMEVLTSAAEIAGSLVMWDWGIDAIHASPPCQAYSVMSKCRPGLADKYPKLIEPVRELLIRTGLPYVIENVPGAPLTPLLMMCGSSFGLGTGDYQLRRHRWFEPSPGWWFMSPPCQHRAPVVGIYGDHGRDRRRSSTVAVYGHGANWGHESFTLAQRQEAMGIDWMAARELSQAIPPAYTEYIGRQLLDHLRETAATG